LNFDAVLPPGAKIEFTAADFDRMEKLSDAFLEKTDDLMQKAIDDAVAVIGRSLRSAWPDEARRQALASQNFEADLQTRWEQPLGELAHLLTIAREFDGGINQRKRAAIAEADNPYTVEALTRLHARACQICDEILRLARGGFPDGAMARWRALDEVAVTALFIQQFGEDTAERYVHHQTIESSRAMADYARCHERLGYEPPTHEEVKSVELAVKALTDRFGESYRRNYGWAAKALKSKDPSFKDVEAAVDLDHLRAHYRLASHAVHANPKGVYFQFGQAPLNEELCCGPSMFGLADPLHCAAISLMQISAAVGLLDLTLDHIVVLRIMQAVVDEIGAAAIAANDAQKEAISNR